MTIKAKNKNGILQKFLGLHWHDGRSPIYFETRWGVHSFGLTYPILCIVLDSYDTVIDRRSLKQNSVFLWNPKYKKVIEIPHPTEEYLSIKIGEKIDLIISS